MHRRFAFLALALGLFATPAATQGQADERQVRALIERMFEALRQQDTATMRATFHPGFRLAITANRDGQPVVRHTDADRFLASIASATSKLDEQISNVEVRVRDNVATVWNDYVFFVDGVADHCGIDAFLLVRETDGWKILQVADTQRREGCG